MPFHAARILALLSISAFGLGEPLREVIVASGQPVPGVAGARFAGFSPAYINSAGEVAFFSRMNVGFMTDAYAIFFASADGTVRLVVQHQTPAPGFPAGYRWSIGKILNFTDDGDIWFQAFVTNDVSGVLVLCRWERATETFRIVLRSGDLVPGSDLPVYEVPAPFAVHAQAGGRAVFGTILGPQGGEQLGALISHDGVTSRIVALEGDLAPGLARPFAHLPAAGFPGTPFFAFLLSSEGEIGYTAGLKGLGFNRGVWFAWDDAGKSRFALRQDAPKLPSGACITGYHQVAATSHSAILFGGDAGTDFRPSIHFANPFGVWTTETGSLRTLAQEGKPAPGVDSGLIFDSYSHLLQSRGGLQFFTGELIEEDRSSELDVIYQVKNGTIAPWIKRGSPAPGFPEAVKVKGALALTINQAGQLHWFCGLRGPGMTQDNNHAVYISQRIGGQWVHQMILREGEPIDLGSGVSVPYSSFEFGSGWSKTGEDGAPRYLNRHGQCVLTVSFGAILRITVPPAAVFQPDVVFGELENSVGDDLHRVEAQVKKVKAKAGTPMEVLLRIQNDGNAPDDLTVQVSPSASGTTVTYRDENDADTTAALLAGMTFPDVPSAGEVRLRATISRSATAKAVSRIEVSATSPNTPRSDTAILLVRP